MSFSQPFLPIPDTHLKQYRLSRVLLYVIFISLVTFFVLRNVFPTLSFSFNFRTPQSTKNTFLDPRLATDQTAITNGKLDPTQTLVGNFDSPGTFSRIRVALRLSKKSTAEPNTKLTVSRSYRAFFLPLDNIPASSFEHPPLYQDDNGIYYAEYDGALRRFVSTQAYLSRYPVSFAVPLSSHAARALPLSETWIGFRVGSLISFAEGIFLVTSETEIRPFGNPDIFLSMGYRFEDVITAHEEEIGIYTRGRILLYGASQAEGTVFHETDSDTYLIVSDRTLKPVTSPEYRRFLIERTTPIDVSLAARKKSFSCIPKRPWYQKTFTCEIPQNELESTFGSAFHLALKNNSTDTPIDIDTLTVSLITDRTHNNFLIFLSQIKSRILNRFGLGNE